MKNRIYINNDQNLIPVTEEYKKIIKKTVNAALRHEKAAFSAEVSVTFTDNEKIHELNLAHRGKDSATDVLSFPLFEKESLPKDGGEQEYVPIGDVVISLEKARAQAEEYGHSFEREIAFLTVHSILHLLGYDHEVSGEDEKYMNDTCEKVLEKLGLTRDYIPEEAQEEAQEDGEDDAVVIAREDMKTGFICILGRPNVGKSTLMNTILGEKVAIVSKKPQTTRNKITGVYTTGCEQFVFIDTPGIHKPKNKLGEYMMKEAGDSVVGTDAVVFIVEPTEKPSKVEQEIAQKINSMYLPYSLSIRQTLSKRPRYSPPLTISRSCANSAPSFPSLRLKTTALISFSKN